MEVSVPLPNKGYLTVDVNEVNADIKLLIGIEVLHHQMLFKGRSMGKTGGKYPGNKSMDTFSFVEDIEHMLYARRINTTAFTFISCGGRPSLRSR